MNEEIKRDEEKLKFLAINELKKESDDFNLLYQKHRRMLDAYEKLPDTLQLREYDKPIGQCERDLKQIVHFSEKDYGTRVFDFAYGDGTISEITGMLNQYKRVVVQYRLRPKRYMLKDFSKKCFFEDEDYGFTVCPSCKKKRSNQKGKPCFVCRNADAIEIKYLLEEINKRKDKIYKDLLEEVPKPFPHPPYRPDREKANCWNCHEEIVKLPWRQCPKCHSYKCSHCGECLCGFGFTKNKKYKNGNK